MKKNVLVNNLSLSDRWLGETEAPETEESEGWKEKGEEDWNWGKPETWEMWELYSCCFWEYMAHIFMKIDQMSDRRIFSLIQGVVIGLPGCEYWIYLCVFRSRGAHWAGESSSIFLLLDLLLRTAHRCSSQSSCWDPCLLWAAALHQVTLNPLLLWPSVVSLLCLSPVFISDGVMFPNLSEHSVSLNVASVEEDSHCMSFAQVNSDCLKHFLSWL